MSYISLYLYLHMSQYICIGLRSYVFMPKVIASFFRRLVFLLVGGPPLAAPRGPQTDFV